MKKMMMLLAILFLALPSTLQAQTNNDFEKMDQFVQKEIKAAHIPGLALGIVKGDQIVHIKGFGKRNEQGEPVTPQTPFILGSTTKSFTAMAIMKLVEEGKVELDAPVQVYLPSVNLPETVTVRYLLNQTSGISKAPIEKNINKQHIGRVFEYSNENYKLLGQIIAAVTGSPYEKLINDRIFSPLDMKHSYTSYALAENDGLAAGYRTWFGVNFSNKVPVEKEYLSAGFLISSAEDMTHYLIVQMNGGRYQNQSVVSSAGIDLMHKPSVKAPMMGEESYYGMGWFNSPVNGTPTIRHSGEVPNYHSTMIILPEQQYGIILLANINNSILISGLIEKIGDGIVDLLAGKDPIAISGKTYYQTYMIMDGTVLIIIVLLIFHFKNIQMWHSRWIAGGWGYFGTIIYPLVVNGLIPILLLTQLPNVLGFDWDFLFDFIPDATLVVFLSAVSLLLAGVGRVAAVAIRRPNETGVVENGIKIELL